MPIVLFSLLTAHPAPLLRRTVTAPPSYTLATAAYCYAHSFYSRAFKASKATSPAKEDDLVRREEEEVLRHFISFVKGRFRPSDKMQAKQPAQQVPHPVEPTTICHCLNSEI